MSRKKHNSYKAFLDNIKIGSGYGLESRTSDIIAHFQPAQMISTHFAPVCFLLDYSTKRYLYVDESCAGLLGFSSQYFIETGLEEYLSRWHPEDFEVINRKVFPLNLDFISAIESDACGDYIFSYNYRFLNEAGSYITILQRFSYIAGDEKGQPAGIIGAVFDISHFKSDNTIVHTIEKVAERQGTRLLELIHKCVWPVFDNPGKGLSAREAEILILIAKGLSSKQIAGILSLSTNTVNNHRKAMLSKAKCLSSSELVSYGVRHGLL